MGESGSMVIVTILVFVCVTLLAAAALASIARRDRVRRRHGTLSRPDSDLDLASNGASPWTRLDPARLGIGRDAQRILRADLLRAGYFGPYAVAGYATARLALLVGLPLVGILLVPTLGGTWGATERVALVIVLLAIAVSLPRATLSRSRRQREAEHRLVFPDYLDMLVVCINAGLSLEAALDRAGREIGGGAVAFRMNLDLMAREMRAGKSTPDALRSLADRLSMPEARSFAALLGQTLELGTDVAQALTTFSDEMRDKRMARAEETAAALPPKLTLPLGLFIFPVVLIAVLAPAVLKVLAVAGR